MEDESFDVLKWWKINRNNYLILAKMTWDFLAIPLSFVAYESTFIIAIMIIDQHCSSLNQEIAKGLIMLKRLSKKILVPMRRTSTMVKTKT
jgi:hypothetical protein